MFQIGPEQAKYLSHVGNRARSSLRTLLPVLCLVVAIDYTEAHAQNEPSQREWSDSTGQFKIQAIYVGRGPAGIVLRRTDGTELTVPVERLSGADQEYLRTLVAPASQPAGANAKPSIAAPSDAGGANGASFVIVQTLVGDKVVSHAGGIVTLIDGDRAYLGIVDGQLGGPKSPLNAPEAEPRFVALVGAPGQERRVELEAVPVFNYGPRRYSLSALRDQLPSPVKLQPLPQVAVGQKLISVGAEFRNDAQRTEVKPFRIETQVASLITAPTGEAIGFAVKEGRSGMLVDERGEVIALLYASSGRSRVIPTQLFQNVLSIDLEALRVRETRIAPREVKLEFLLQTRDLHPTLHARYVPRMLLTHLPEARKKEADWQYLRDRERFAIVDRKWKNPDAGVELEFQPVEKWDEEFEMPVPASSKLNAAHWYASYTFSLDAKLPPVFYQAVSVDAATGQIVQLLSDDSHIKVPAEQPLPILFKHPVSQYDQGAQIMPRHAGGGRLLTVDAYTPKSHYTPRRELDGPQSVHRPLVKEVRIEQGAAVAMLALNTYPGPARPDLTGPEAEHQARIRASQRSHVRQSAPLAFSADGKYLFVVDGKEGFGVGPTLRKIDTSTWSEVTSLRLFRECRTIGLSQGGLIVPAVYEELWLVDPETLQVKRRWKVDAPGDFEIAARPDMKMAYIFSGEGLLVYDSVAGEGKRLVSHKTLENLGTEANQRNIGSMSTLALSHDGRYLFLTKDRIHRMRIEGVDLIHEEAGPVFGGAALFRLSVSDDLRYVGVPLQNVQGAVVDKLPLYDPMNLAQTKLSLEVGPDPTAVAFDDASGKFFAASAARHVMQFDASGKLTAECKLADSEDIRRIFVVPNHGAAVYWGDVLTVVDPNAKRLEGVPRAAVEVDPKAKK